MSRKWTSVQTSLPDELELVDLTVDSYGHRHIVQAHLSSGEWQRGHFAGVTFPLEVWYFAPVAWRPASKASGRKHES